MIQKGSDMDRNSRRREGGQTIVIAALAMIPLLIMVGLVVDGGFAFSQQRRSQNAMDAAANAGAIVIMENLPFRITGQALIRTDQNVRDAVNAVATTNGIDPATVTALYTKIDGDTDLDNDPGTPPVAVGSLGAVAPPIEALGVEVSGSMNVDTFFASIAGLGDFTASARATAVTGSAPGICSSEEDCGFLPVTFPTALTACDGTGQQMWGSGGPYTFSAPPFTAANEIIIPLCGTESGSVGWLDILPDNPACTGNGAAELACNILNPNHPGFDLPIWIDAQTGNINSTLVQDALNTLTGPTPGVYEAGLDKIVTIPLYDCVDNNIPQVSPGPPCPTPAVSSVGTNTSYRVVGLGALVFDKAYIQANNPECQAGLGTLAAPGTPPAGGNGSTGCLKGWLTQISGPGEVGTPTSTSGTVFRVQLIR